RARSSAAHPGPGPRESRLATIVPSQSVLGNAHGTDVGVRVAAAGRLRGEFAAFPTFDWQHAPHESRHLRKEVRHSGNVGERPIACTKYTQPSASAAVTSTATRNGGQCSTGFNALGGTLGEQRDEHDD